MILIPNTDKKFLQSNRSDILGNLRATWNIDLQDNLGAIRIGQRMKIITKKGDTNATNMGIPGPIVAFGSRIVSIAGTRVIISSKLAPDMTFAEDANTNFRTDWSSDSDDLCNFNATLVGFNCAQGKLYSLSAATGGTWTTRSTISGGGTNGILTYFKKFNRLYVVSGSNIHSVDTAWAISTSGTTYDLSLTGNDDGGTIQTCIAGNDKIWIGMKRGAFGGTSDNLNPGMFSSIYEWDGISNQVTKEYKIPSMGVMAMVIENDIPIVIDTEGVLRKFDGQGFTEIGRLPLRRGQQLLTNAGAGWTDNYIHPKGLAVTKDGTILALINNQSTYGFNTLNNEYEDLPSGIWEFDEKGSAVHKHPITLMPMSSTSVTEHGQNKLSSVGALAYIRRNTTSAYGISMLMAGAEVYTDASTTLDAIFMDAPWPTGIVTYPEGQKYGYITTTWLSPENTPSVATLDAMWQKAFVRFRQFLDSGDKLTMKYRFVKATPIEVSITWASTTTFTTSTDLTNYVGYEFEGLQGTGSGKCSHIVSVINNAGTYTITLDETYTGVGTSTAQGRVQNWVKFKSYAAQTDQYVEGPIGKVGQRIQLKICLQATGDAEIQDIVVVDKPNRLAQ